MVINSLKRKYGNTIEEIAINKLGIVKENVPLVTINNPLINNLIIETCKNNNSKLILVDQKDIKNVSLKIGSSKFDYKNYKNILLKMSGLHQTENASLVIEAIILLNGTFVYLISYLMMKIFIKDYKIHFGLEDLKL